MEDPLHLKPQGSQGPPYLIRVPTINFMEYQKEELKSGLAMNFGNYRYLSSNGIFLSHTSVRARHDD